MTQDKGIPVVCTGRGEKKHTRYKFNIALVTPTGVRVNVLREAATPDLAGHTIDGLAVPGYVVVKSYDPHYGADGWRWKCPVCGEDQQFSSEAGVREWLTACGRVADIARRT